MTLNTDTDKRIISVWKVALDRDRWEAEGVKLRAALESINAELQSLRNGQIGSGGELLQPLIDLIQEVLYAED